MLNKVMLLGRLTRDPEVKYTPNTNTLICTFGLAVGRRFAKETDEQKADFINIVAWGKTGEFCSKYFNKGQQVCICGRLATRNYDDKDGKKVYVTEVIAEEVHFADSKKEANEYGPVPQPTNDGFIPVVDDSQLPF